MPTVSEIATYSNQKPISIDAGSDVVAVAECYSLMRIQAKDAPEIGKDHFVLVDEIAGSYAYRTFSEEDGRKALARYAARFAETEIRDIASRNGFDMASPEDARIVAEEVEFARASALLQRNEPSTPWSWTETLDDHLSQIAYERDYEAKAAAQFERDAY